jgi:hypothetical protein
MVLQAYCLADVPFVIKNSIVYLAVVGVFDGVLPERF